MTDKKLKKKTGDNLRAIKALRQRTKQLCRDIHEREEAGQRITYFGKQPGKIDVQV